MEQMGTNHPHLQPATTWVAAAAARTINNNKLAGGSQQCPMVDTDAGKTTARLTTERIRLRRQVDLQWTGMEEDERDLSSINKGKDYDHHHYCASTLWYNNNKLLHNNSHTNAAAETSGPGSSSSSSSSSSRSDFKCHLNDQHPQLSNNSNAHPSRRSHWRRRKAAAAADQWQPSSILILASGRNNNLYLLLTLSLSMCVYITTTTTSSHQYLIFAPVKAGHQQAGTRANNLNATNSQLVDLDVDGPTLYGLRRFSLPTKFIFGGGGRNRPTQARNTNQQKRQLAATVAPNSFDSRSVFRYELTGGRSDAPTQAAAAPWLPEMGRLQHQQDGNNNNNRLASIQSQLSELRRQLELELSLERGQVTLGSPCFNASDCRNSIVNSHCKLDNFTCSCLPHHIQYNSTTCLPPSLLGFECLIDAQCQQKVHGSYCSSANLCACRSQFVTYRKDKCLPASKINDYCLTDSQCQLNDIHSHCKWKIANVYGLCKCPPNYKHITTVAHNNGSIGLSSDQRGPPGSARDNGGNSGGIIRCAPRLGDSCFTDDECQLATKNSVCKEPKVFPYSRLSITWRSSGASSRRCYCSAGFTESANRLDCQRQTQTSSTGSGTTPATANAKDGSGGGGETATPASVRRSSVPTTVTSVQESALLAAPNSMSAKNHYEFIMPTQAANQTVTMQMSANGQDSQEFDIRSSADQVTPTASIIMVNQTSAQTATQPSDRNQLNRLNNPQRPPTKSNETTLSIHLTTTSTQRPRQLTRRPPIPVVSNAVGGNGSGGKVATGSGHQARPLPAGMRVSSLGKPCSSRIECQARDRHSDCLNGFCECIKPTSRCMANSTGCHKDTFQCRNGQCISWYFVCDQFRNCDDGSDEDDCIANSCPPEAFQCDSGPCLARGKLCNGKLDCPDGSDERHCSAGASSRVTTPISTSSLQPTLTTAKTSTGDGQLAADSSRQQLLANSYGTTSPFSSCHPRAFACDNGQCLPAYVFCNAVEDCSDGSDEIERVCERVWPNRKWGQPLGNATTTTTTTATPTPTSKQQHPDSQHNHGSRSRLTAEIHYPLDSPLVRSNRISMEKLLAASLTGRTPEGRGRGLSGDHRPQNRMEFSDDSGSARGRGRRSPAASSNSASPPAAYTCPKMAFTCRNGKCRSSAILCSGVDGCGDNSDEDRCEVCQCAAP